MTQQTKTKAAVFDQNGRGADSDAGRRFKMVQGIRQEIIAMLAAKKRRFSADDYQILGKEGILTEDDRIELIEGEIVVMSPIGDRHLACVDMLASQLFGGVRGEAIVRVQGSIRLGKYSEPQPDIALLRHRDDYYASRSATPEDILLLIEVADSSLDRDRNDKLPRYARAGVPEAWIANLLDDCVERFRNPTEDGYSDVIRLIRSNTISPELLPDVELRVDDILP